MGSVSEHQTTRRPDDQTHYQTTKRPDTFLMRLVSECVWSSGRLVDQPHSQCVWSSGRLVFGMCLVVWSSGFGVV